MKEESLHEFYAYAVLPQFGFIGQSFEWTNCEHIGWDEDVHYFTHQGDNFALFFRDYGGMEDEDIKEMAGLEKAKYDYIYLKLQPETKFLDFKLFAPSLYAHNVTGTFTLVKLKDQ